MNKMCPYECDSSHVLRNFRTLMSICPEFPDEIWKTAPFKLIRLKCRRMPKQNSSINYIRCCLANSVATRLGAHITKTLKN